MWHNKIGRLYLNKSEYFSNLKAKWLRRVVCAAVGSAADWHTQEHVKECEWQAALSFVTVWKTTEWYFRRVSSMLCEFYLNKAVT